MICKSGTACDECKDGFSLDDTGTCSSFGTGVSATIGVASTTSVSSTIVGQTQSLVYECEPGCQTCVLSTDASTSFMVCLKAKDGYSIVSGVLVKCDPSCRACVSTTTTVCTDCYPGYYLLSGACTVCNQNSQTLRCSSEEPSYAVLCKAGYTATYNSGGIGGVCRACASYCNKCDQNGPGKCDDGHCQKGSVKLQGTDNCTLCVNGCPDCSSHDPTSCTSCGVRRYSDANSVCQTCPDGCHTCTSATSCQSCIRGYTLDGTSCLATPIHCAIVDAASGSCSSCFVGYSVQSNVCTADTCTSACKTCPQGSYLSNATCTVCPSLSSNCVNCDANTPADCFECADGFYLDSNK